MTEYAAQIENNIVKEIIVGNYLWAIDNLGGNWVDCSNNGNLVVACGYIYDPITETFSAPPARIDSR